MNTMESKNNPYPEEWAALKAAKAAGEVVMEEKKRAKRVKEGEEG